MGYYTRYPGLRRSSRFRAWLVLPRFRADPPDFEPGLYFPVLPSLARTSWVVLSYFRKDRRPHGKDTNQRPSLPRDQTACTSEPGSSFLACTFLLPQGSSPAWQRHQPATVSPPRPNGSSRTLRGGSV